jgi:hypothetical protein
MAMARLLHLEMSRFKWKGKTYWIPKQTCPEVYGYLKTHLPTQMGWTENFALQINHRTGLLDFSPGQEPRLQGESAVNTAQSATPIEPGPAPGAGVSSPNDQTQETLSAHANAPSPLTLPTQNVQNSTQATSALGDSSQEPDTMKADFILTQLFLKNNEPTTPPPPLSLGNHEWEIEHGKDSDQSGVVVVPD